MQPIEQILCREPRGVLTLTGAGGKTSLMFHLARLLERSGKRVLTTTTTKIFFPTADQSETVLIDADPEEILRQVSSGPGPCRGITAAAAQHSDTGKLIGFPPEVIETFAASALFDWIIVEADGSARRPLKAHAGHEPVVPSATTVLVAVAGLEVLGEPLSEELVFRSEIAGKLMGVGTGETITEAALARLIAHPSGLFTGALPGMRRFVFLNKADNPERLARGAGIAKALSRLVPPVAEALLVGQALDTMRVHAVYPLEILP
jgi:probable selenium-dependent hydroxylase accessory protein YqeC